MNEQKVEIMEGYRGGQLIWRTHNGIIDPSIDMQNTEYTITKKWITKQEYQKFFVKPCKVCKNK